jgi:hypothetical protein
MSSLAAVLRRKRNLCVILGGAREALETEPYTNRILLDRRKGFIKLALEEGVEVVPVYTFGETNLFTQVPNRPGSLVRSIQDFLLPWTNLSAPLLTSGPMPKRTPMMTVMGRPISFPRMTDPSKDDVDKYHAMYKKALIELFDKHKKSFYTDEELKTAELNIVM